jgi:hypothetical protein
LPYARLQRDRLGQYHGDIVNECCDELLNAAEKMTPCECAVAGWCARHQLNKVPHFHMLCKTNIGYFEQYERGEGPGQIVGGKRSCRRIGLGDIVAWLIKVATFNRIKMCLACRSRRTRLNRFQIWPYPWWFRR